MAATPGAKMNAVHAAITENLGVFEDAVRKAKAADPAFNEGSVVAPTMDAFKKLVEAVHAGMPFRDASREAARLARMRSHVLPAEALDSEAQSAIAEMVDWGVPAAALAAARELRAVVAGNAGPEQAAPGNPADAPIAASASLAPPGVPSTRARAALNKLLDDYDYWDGYTDWYFEQMTFAVLAGVGFTLVGLAGGLVAFRYHEVWPGFILASTAGAAVSIMLKLPGMSVYGEVSSFWLRAVSRLVAGVAVGAMACGLLSLGVVNLSLPDGFSQVQLIDGCAGVGDCRPRWIFVLMALGILFGFSERGIATFESAVFGPREPDKS